MTAAQGRELLPVACTLGSEDGAERVQEWRRVLGDSGISRDLGPGRITLRFRNTPGIGDELDRLVTSERDCCAFLGWELRQADDEWLVDITGRDEDLQSLSFAGQ